MPLKKRNAAASVIGALAALGTALFIWRAMAQITIPRGYDSFSIPANAQTTENFSLAAGTLTDSAGSPSQAFSGAITFQGGAAVSGYTGDTLIERIRAVTVPGDTPLQVNGFSLASVGTMPITFADGTSASYSVTVAQSPSTKSTGKMSFASGGTYENTLNINVQYTFTANGEPTFKFDAAPNGIPAIAYSSSGTWQVNGASVTLTRQTGQSAMVSHDIVLGPKKMPNPASLGLGLNCNTN
jgi:hypothetical protein